MGIPRHSNNTPAPSVATARVYDDGTITEPDDGSNASCSGTLVVSATMHTRETALKCLEVRGNTVGQARLLLVYVLEPRLLQSNETDTNAMCPE